MGNAAGWRASRESRRPHTRERLKRRARTPGVSRKRRTSVKDRERAMRLKGLLRQP
jgi:hypothetical protein